MNGSLQLAHPDNPCLELRAQGNRLICEETGDQFPIVDGIPRLVREVDDGQKQTMDGFSYKWEKTPDFGRTREHQRVFMQAYREWFGVKSTYDFAQYMEGKSVLNAGCGCGR